MENDDLRKMIFDQLRTLTMLATHHEAFLRAICKVLPKEQSAMVLELYERYKNEAWEEQMLDLESKNPKLAAEFDKHRPIPGDSKQPGY